MFICDDCLTKKFQNKPRYGKSAGPCELCEQYRLCSDIQSGLLIKREPAGLEKPQGPLGLEEQIDVLRTACLFLKHFFAKLEEGSEVGDPLRRIRQEFHAPVHNMLDHALSVTTDHTGRRDETANLIRQLVAALDESDYNHPILPAARAYLQRAETPVQRKADEPAV